MNRFHKACAFAGASVFMGLALSTCDLAHAGGTEDSSTRYVFKPRPVTALEAPVLTLALVNVFVPVVSIETFASVCEDNFRVLQDRDDLYKYRCGHHSVMPSFGMTAEPNRYNDVSPN